MALVVSHIACSPVIPSCFRSHSCEGGDIFCGNGGEFASFPFSSQGAIIRPNEGGTEAHGKLCLF